MKKIYLVHCWDGTSNDGWYPWIEKQLNSDNVEVIKFDMPNTANSKQQIFYLLCYHIHAQLL